MTANLRTLIEEERELSMNRDLMPATTLTTLKKIAFTLLCCTVLMVVAAPAQTLQSIKADPGTNNPPPAGAILDLANPPQAIPGGGNQTYQQYTANFTATSTTTAITFAFREDPAFISFSNASVVDTSTDSQPNLLTNGDFSGGTYTNNGNSSTPIGWTYANVYGASSGGVVQASCGEGSSDDTPIYGVGNCWYDGAVQAYDAISQTITTNPGDNYVITFWVADNSGCRTDIGEPACSFSDISTNGDSSDTNGNGINVTVYAQEGAPPQQGQPINTDNPQTLTQTFTQNSTAGQEVVASFDFLTAFNAGTLEPIAPGTTPFVGFSGMTELQYHNSVQFTALADTSCLTALGFTDSHGTPLCVGTTFTATTTANPTPSGANLPHSTGRNIVYTLTQDFDPAQGSPVTPGPPPLLNIPPGYAPVIVEFSDAGNCPYPADSPKFGLPCPSSVGTSFQDGPAKGSGTPKPASSTMTFGCCEPEWTATPTIPLWTNQTASIPVSFSNAPPPTPSPNPGNFHAAQGLGDNFGAVAQGVVLDPVVDFPTEQTALASSPNPPYPGPCPVSTNWMNQVVVPYTAPGTLTQWDNGGLAAGFTEGAYQLLYAPLDCNEFLGLQWPASIDLSDAAGGGQGQSGPNVGHWFSVPFNVDTTKPTISGITLNPPGPIFAQGVKVTASMTCQDLPGGGPASGIKSCGGIQATLTNGTGPGSFIANAPFTTAGTGLQNFNFPAGATDVAGNSSGLPTAVPYTVVGSADLGIAMLALCGTPKLQLPCLLIKKGQNLTYVIGVANSGPNTAYNVIVSDVLPAGATFVSAGYAIDSCTFGNGAPSCTIVPPTTNCGGTPGNCSIGSLPAWTKNNPKGAVIQITVTANAAANTTMKNTATVGEVNADPNSKNNTTPAWSTLVTK